MRPLVLFYLLVFYVLLQFTWWAYLLIDLNTEVFQNKVELLELQQSYNSAIAGEEAELHAELESRWAMVVGEGMVFLTILLLGIHRTRLAFKKEYALSRQQKNFLLSITHEFKSPLAAVKLNLQTIQKRVLTREQQEQIVSKALNETERIHNLVENALLAARIESHSFNLQKEEFNLTECIEGTIENRSIPGSTRVKVRMNLQQGVYIKGDALAVSSIILNLLENAEKYSPEDSEVVITLTSDDKNAVIEVADHGKGVPDAEKSRIFNKFYRVGNEETRNTKGTGLGLFIVSHIVDLHNGTVILEDNKPTGAVFKVILPASPELVA
jgi:two-component system, OmpR family, phosphate regulon sensor histidine kinase PhoR